MNPTINVFLDDEREPPNDGEHWVVVRTAEACMLLLTHLRPSSIDRLSLDHDLGTEDTGYDVAVFVEGCAANGRRVAKYLLCHSANPVGRARIERAFASARRHLETASTPETCGRDGKFCERCFDCKRGVR